MATEHSTQIEDRNPKRVVLTDRLLKALTWNGDRVGPDGKLVKSTGGKQVGRRTVCE